MNKEQCIDLVTSHILEYLPKEYKDARVEVRHLQGLCL